MSRTLADMTSEERQQCRGMWCDYLTLQGDPAQVIYRWEKDGLASVHDPKITDGRTNQYVMVRSLTPRFDLMRAWNPDGTAPDGSWQHSSAELPLIDYSGTYTQHYRRWESDWEAHDE